MSCSTSHIQLRWLGYTLWNLYLNIPVTEASDRISWPTVAVAWGFSLLTTFIVLGVALVIIKYAKHLRKKRRERPPKFNRELSVQSEASDLTRISVASAPNVYGNGGYRRVPSRESTTNRRKSDFISSWCSKHSLSEVIAANLRENGFNSKEQIESLLPNDVVTLGLPNLATQVQLRGVLEKLQRTKDITATAPQALDATSHPQLELSTQSGHSSLTHPIYTVSQTQSLGAGNTKTAQTLPALPRSMSSSDRIRPRSSTTEESSLLLTTPSPQQTSPLSSSYNTSRHSLAHLSEEPLPCSSALTILPGRTKASRLSFHGLLSDSGLYELAESLGTEWRHLATILGISKAQQEHLVNNYPNNTKQQIYEMLRFWRENERGEKEQVKAVLSKAFTRVRRKDLADKILREQVHGSDEHLQGPQRMNSVV